VELNTVIPYIIGVIILFFLGKIFVLPIKSILKLLGNSILGAILIYVINLIGNAFNFHIGLNFVTIIFVALLGVPGAVVLTLIRILIG
jgi:inhibitor of the pro-sigma K processing machinery